MTAPSYKDVYASYIDDQTVEFECPFCYERHCKDDRPRRGARPLVHRFPSGGDRTRGARYIMPECATRRAPYGFPYSIYVGFRLLVDSTTAGSAPPPSADVDDVDDSAVIDDRADVDDFDNSAEVADSAGADSAGAAARAASQRQRRGARRFQPPSAQCRRTSGLTATG